MKARRDHVPPRYSRQRLRWNRSPATYLPAGAAGLERLRRPPASRASATAATSAADGRHRVHAHPVVGVRVDNLITDAVAVLVNPPPRLLKQAGLGVSLRDGAFQDEQLLLVHRDPGEGPRLIGVVSAGRRDLRPCPAIPMRVRSALRHAAGAFSSQTRSPLAHRGPSTRDRARAARSGRQFAFPGGQFLAARCPAAPCSCNRSS